MPKPERQRFQEPPATRVVVAGSDRIALAGRFDDIRIHQHAAPVIVVGLDGPVRFIAADRERTGRAVVIAPGFAHAVDAMRSRLALFLLPAGAIQTGGPVHDLARPHAWRELGAALMDGELSELEPVDRCLARERLGARPLDDRLQRAVARLADRLDENVSIDEAADGVGLSTSRLMALAHDQLGAPLRTYRRWLRTIRVAREFGAGASITEAAHAAGFASSAHLAMAAREHFGIRPSDVLSPRSRNAIRST